MKRSVSGALIGALLLGCLSGCANSNTTSKSEGTPTETTTASENFSDEMKIPYAIDLSEEDGSDSVERSGDHENSPYFAHPDVYNMESTNTLTVLHHFKTQQQTSEWSCGVASALMVLNWYGKLGDWNEESLAKLRHSLKGKLKDYPGTTLNQAIDMFEGVGGFDVVSTKDYPDGVWMDDIQGWLKDGKPVMICWNDWGGHWQIIIGYDTMGTEEENDDVFLVADPYDTTDHNQDGYGIYSAERLMYNFSMYDAFPESEGGSDMLFLVASPKES